MGTSFISLYAIIAVLIIAFLFAPLPQVNHKTRYRILYSFYDISIRLFLTSFLSVFSYYMLVFILHIKLTS